jgi:hypothetical protein
VLGAARPDRAVWRGVERPRSHRRLGSSVLNPTTASAVSASCVVPVAWGRVDAITRVLKVGLLRAAFRRRTRASASSGGVAAMGSGSKPSRAFALGAARLGIQRGARRRSARSSHLDLSSWSAGSVAVSALPASSLRSASALRGWESGGVTEFE